MPVIEGASNFTVSGDARLYEIHGNAVINQLADANEAKKIQSTVNLPRAQASHKDYETKKKSGPCFPGTRQALLREMTDWMTDSGESRMYVLSGLAGIGKSTVVYTLVTQAAELGLLGASFFFSRDEADRRSAKKFFTTIAFQLCVYDETFSKAIGDVLLTECGAAATTQDPQTQLRVLILDPLRSIVQSRARPILVVVDALDECDEDDEDAVVMGLSQLVRLLPSFRVILTTRPQPLVDYLFGNHDGHKIFRLQDIEDKIVDGDIRLYLSHSFSQEQVRARLLNPKGKWCASDEDIESLVKAAGRLFIIASTAVLYVLNKALGAPGARMKRLLSEIAQDRTPFHALNHFYSVIIRSAVQVDEDDDDDDDIVNQYQIIVGTIVVIQTPLPIATLAFFVGEDSENIYAMLRNLQSVILLDSDDIPRIYHKSFPDYLTDPARCKNPRLRIDPRIRHTQIAIRCFEIMDEHLKYNILGLGDWARFMSNEDGLKEDGITEEQLQEKIPQQLRYACIYWANHLEVANVEDADLMKGLKKFVDEHMLHWLEVLSLIGNLDLAHRAIRVGLTLLKSTSSDLHRLLSDASRFMPKFYEVVNRSALHTYYSALPFTPTDSLLYARYIEEAVHNICDIEGGPENWDAHVANLRHEEYVEVIKFSLDSALFVSCTEQCEQGKLKIWDAATGVPISTIPGHRFAVANNFSTFASSEDNLITYYNVKGSAMGTTITTSSRIQALVFSSESGRVAAALADGTVWLWDSGNAELVDCFDDCFDDCFYDCFYDFPESPDDCSDDYFYDCFYDFPESPDDCSDDYSNDCSDESEGSETQLHFSPTGTRLAYSSANGPIVKLRDGISGRFIADLRCGSWHYFEFSGNGSRIASLSKDCGLTLWDSESGGLVGVVRDVGDMSNTAFVDSTLAISANGSLLATADLNQVMLWSDSLAQIEVLEIDLAHSMAFSLDNILAIATDLGVKLYNVKTHSFISSFPFTGNPVTLAFSPDCTRLAVGGYDGSVYLWNVQSIDACGGLPSKTEAAALALSRDCSRLACGFEDGTVELWETSPTKRRIASHQAHTERVQALGFSPDGGLFASGGWRGATIKLWNGGDGALRGTLRVPSELQAVALSNSVLVAGCRGGVTLWSFDTLSPSLIHTFMEPGHAVAVAIAENNALIAVVIHTHDFDNGFSRSLSLLDVVNHTTIATFDATQEREGIHTMTFLPDNSQLVVQCHNGDFRYSLNLINKHTMEGPALEHLIQLPNIPLWHVVPVWHCRDNDQHYLSAFFSQHRSPVPILLIPRDLAVTTWTQGLSMIVLGCRDGRILLVRLILS
ncbi:hypothetical protein M378DRAFT_10761 [Amanita muscaria Koide BX008]|uniref:NACHT domain-containing protein n=1 Tax=Amanita muscaria (strain Koide BX008) TaxID=946122 RepID=A0A0C2WV83_AMAMK|nr:hypothetical protein M378DRAFT_10761 [Amanita muscaria Koide BX008]